MVISPDRKKILLNKKHTPAVKETNWNFLVIVLSSIMVVIGVPSMFSASFPNSVGTWGSTIFVICVSVIVLFLGILYFYVASDRYKESFTRFNTILYIGIFVLLILISLVVLSTAHLAYFLFFIYLACYVCLFGYFFMITPAMQLQFKKLCNLCLTGLLLFYFGGVIISIGKLNPLLFGFIEFGFLCVFLGALLYGIGYGILFSKNISSIKLSQNRSYAVFGRIKFILIRKGRHGGGME